MMIEAQSPVLIAHPKLPTDTAYKAAEFIETYTGRAFYPLSPRQEDISIIDIAHGLSLQCRYGGQISDFYCPTLDQRVLTDDLRWVPAGDLDTGARLVGFDETPTELGQAGVPRRRFRPATVTEAIKVKRRVMRLELEDGSTTRAAVEHPWLVATKQSRNQKWQTVAEIAAALKDGRVRYMHKFFEPWKTASSREAGWLAGLFDGEGCLCLVNKGTRLEVAQRPGPVLDFAHTTLQGLGFDAAPRAGGAADVMYIPVLGGWREIARLLGSVRPIRLLTKFQDALRAGEFDKQFSGIGSPLRVVKCYDEGEEWCAGLETDTHTYLCEGFGAHNSVAEHSVLLAMYAEQELHANVIDCLQILMHDAPEAFMTDIPRPVKQYMPEYREWDHGINEAIRTWLSLEGIKRPDFQDEIDSRIIVDERAQLKSDSGLDWGHNLTPLGLEMQKWPPRRAEVEFLMRYTAYTNALFHAPQYMREGWNGRAPQVYHDSGSDDPKILDILEVDLRGGVAKVKLRSEPTEEGKPGMLIRDRERGRFPHPAWHWLHGKFTMIEAHS